MDYTYNILFNMSNMLFTTIKDILVSLQDENIDKARDTCIKSMKGYKLWHTKEILRRHIEMDKKVTEMTRRDIALQIAWNYLGKPYIWGGNDPIQGFDCSGYIIECLKSVGLLPRKGDWTAQRLFEIFKNRQVETPYAGCLVFWGQQQQSKYHVEMCINSHLSIGASGGSSSTISVEQAIKEDAYIKVRPFSTLSSDIVTFIDPFL